MMPNTHLPPTAHTSKTDSDEQMSAQHLMNESMRSSTMLSGANWAPVGKRDEDLQLPGRQLSLPRRKAQCLESPFRARDASAPENMDPIMKRMELRYETVPAERQYAIHSSRKQRGDQKSDVVDASVQAMREETVALLTRHLPCIPTSLPDVGECKDRTKCQGDPVADDRITVQTIHKLLCKGHYRDRKRQIRRCRSRQAADELDELSPQGAVDALTKQVSRLEPPFVGKMMEAKMYAKQLKEDPSPPRDVWPVSADVTPFSRAPANYYHSHLLAPPPSRCGRKESPRGGATTPQEQILPLLLSVLDDTPPTKISSTLPLTPSTAVGDDSNIVEQVVAHAAAKRRPDVAVVSGTLADNGSNGDPCCLASDLKLHPSHKPVYSALDAVLSVSKEYERAQQLWPGRSASHISAARRGIMERITSFHSSRVPPEFWVSIHHPTLPGTRLLQHPELVKRGQNSNVSEKTLIFPAVNAAGRAQVYLLADTLDRMFEENPGDLEVLADKDLAHLLIPEELDEGRSTPTGTIDMSEKSSILRHVKTQEEAHSQYIQSAERVMEIINIGFTELARQIGTFCIERGALLDSLRIVVNDLQSSLVSLVTYCKERARQEVRARRQLAASSRQDVETVLDLREELKRLQTEVQSLREVNNEYVKKAHKYDTLIERLMLKNNMFYKHSSELHLSMLMELEESYTESTNKGMDALYHHSATNAFEAKVADAPVIRMTSMKQKEQQESEKKLYVESYRLIGVLSRTLQSVENVCEPLYDRVELPKHKSTVNVASSRWAAIASAVGSYEVEKKHRRRVFDLFSQWNSIQEPIKTSGSPGRRARDEEIGSRIHGSVSCGHSFVTASTSTEATPDTTERESRLRNMEYGTSPGNKVKQFLSTASERLRPITKEDLLAMDVRDCTPEEINALYTEDFDMAAYLNPEWDPPADVELSPMVLQDMLHDVTESLMHITLRMEALSASSFVNQCLKPAALPPAHPEEPCSLCGRKDRAAIGRKSRGEALQKVANEVQRRYDLLGQKCQRAEAEREKLRKELQIQQAHEYKLAREFGMREEELRRVNAELSEENNRRGRRRRSQVLSSDRPRSSLMRSSVLSEVLNLSGSLEEGQTPGYEDK